jgi:three-Cys-motif partner protein
LAVRCQLPQQSRFRLAIVDGFAGGGRYKCGSPGSPLIFLEELRIATETFNLRRQAEGMSPIDIECLLVLNDSDSKTIALLKENAAPLPFFNSQSAGLAILAYSFRQFGACPPRVQ